MNAIRAAAVLSHAFTKDFKKKGSLETHFSNSTHEADFTEAECIVAFFDFVHAALELDAFFLVRFFD